MSAANIYWISIINSTLFDHISQNFKNKLLFFVYINRFDLIKSLANLCQLLEELESKSICWTHVVDGAEQIL